MFPFTYVAQTWDEDEQKYFLERGIGFCEDFADAASIIEERMRSSLVAIRELQLYEPSTVLSLPKEAFDKVSEHLHNEELFCEVECDKFGNELKEGAEKE